MVVACVGVLGGATAAHAQPRWVCRSRRRSSSTARSSARSGSLTLNNTTNESLRVTVTRAPVAPAAQRQRLLRPAHDLHALRARHHAQSFTIGAGAKRPVSFRMLRRTSAARSTAASTSLGKPTNTKGRKGIIPQLPADLQAAPEPGARSRYKLKHRRRPGPLRRLHPAGPQPRQHDRPDRRHATRSPARARARGTIAGDRRVLPGKLVGLNLGSTRGMKKGTLHRHGAPVKQGQQVAPTCVRASLIR